jgi:hypothetical protein
MSTVIAAAIPVLPGKSDRVRQFEQELEPYRAEWDRLSMEMGDFSFYNMYLRSSPQGDLVIYVFELNDPAAARTGFTDSDHDRWWVEYFEDVHGIDLERLSGETEFPELVFHWEPPG